MSSVTDKERLREALEALITEVRNSENAMATIKGSEVMGYAAGLLDPISEVADRALAALDSPTPEERLRGEAVEALRLLVFLKDGPRDDYYEHHKPLAWKRAREVLAALDSPQEARE